MDNQAELKEAKARVESLEAQLTEARQQLDALRKSDSQLLNEVDKLKKDQEDLLVLLADQDVQVRKYKDRLKSLGQPVTYFILFYSVLFLINYFLKR